MSARGRARSIGAEHSSPLLLALAKAEPILATFTHLDPEA